MLILILIHAPVGISLTIPLKIKHVGFADLKRLVEIEVAADTLLSCAWMKFDASRQQAMRSASKG